MKAHFVMMAEYNAWANARLYAAAAQLPDEAYRRDVGAFFGSLHRTLNHVLTADRIWMWRFTGSGEHPSSLDAIVCDDLPSLTTARHAEDERISSYVRALGDADMEAELAYRTMSGAQQRGMRREILAHLFNHQTHHRGQAHTILSLLGVREPPSMDISVMLRERGARG